MDDKPMKDGYSRNFFLNTKVWSLAYKHIKKFL